MSTSDETVGGLASLYLGNILYAVERCALSLEAEGKPVDAAFYRGIGRKLADAHGRARSAPPDSSPSRGIP
ncbi:MAG TPA: hypothetical protein DGD08_09965 [Gemmatimonas aurantiaca]|uniref:Uncharacterized protein n=2 Tax=Gemmatimonas aurantiaca TaxID=173480 RepID=C1A9N7_GEMAT|nr:hypothetical protein [Gemmatimonas aurantiaca]BAH39214.1 hypothetical protein GAU_2172 [Gemmatimonas aurantiaca T-27]HCT57513.1 hypothetical protein [Gemmatimonas aurantiaca]